MLKKILYTLIASLSIGAIGCSGDAAKQSCTLTSYSATSNGNIGIAQGGTTTARGLSVAQSFMVAAAGTATTATVTLLKVGTIPTLTQTLTATLEGNTTGGTPSNYPNGVAVATSNTLDPSTISSTNPSTYVFVFKSSASLTANTIYWLRIKTSAATSSSNYIEWMGYSGGTGGYQVDGTSLNAVYETTSGSGFGLTDIGSNFYLLFFIGC